MKKIIIDARLYGLEHAGPGRYVLNFVNNLSKIDDKNRYYLLLRKKYYDSLKLPSNFVKVLADYQHYTFAEQIHLPLLLYRIKPDLVHFLMFNNPILYFGKFVVTIHDLTMHKFKGGEASTRNLLIRNIWRLGYYLTFAKAVYFAQKILVPSKSVKEEVISYYKLNANKISVTHEGIDSAINLKKKVDVARKYDLKHKYFIYSGSAYPHKNLKIAIGAIAELNKSTNEIIQLVLVSSRSIFTDRVMNWVKKIKADKFVKHLGFVSDSDLANLYKNSLAYVYPTLSEGFGLPGLEAMSVGALVICSDIPVLREIYSNNAIYFDPSSINSLVGSMQKIIGMNLIKKNKLLKKSETFINRYSWEKMTSQTLEIYNSI